MRKIGVLTFHKAINNGAVLQAFALTHSLTKIGAVAEYIDYTAKKIKESYYIKPLRSRTSVKSILLYILNDKNKFKTQRKFYEFVEKYIPMSQQTDEFAISDTAKKYDILISGGDQVWNLDLTGNDYNYYLNFAFSGKKSSYGSSFGKLDFSEEEKENIKICLSQYTTINVRENSAKHFVETVLGMKCSVVPDPVFLLTKQEWIETLGLKEKKGKYILFFELHNNPVMRKFAIWLSKEKNLPIMRITNSFDTYKDMRAIKRTGPVDFLELIMNSEYVITDSFHASAFSLIFGKKLYIGLKKRELAALNTRIDTLTKCYGIQDQVITENFSESEIDYAFVNDKIKQERFAGISALGEMVK